MKRKDFLFQFGAGVAGLSVIGFIQACQKRDQAASVDFNIDMTMPEYSQVQNLGGYVYYQNVIIARDTANNIVAVSSLCSYDACTVTFDPTQNSFLCPCHQDLFDTSGQVQRGPANSPLIRYNTQVSGSIIRVYS